MMELVLFNMATTCVIIIAFNLLVVELNDTFNMEAMIAFIDLYLMLGLTFAHFYLSEWITSDLSDIGDIFYNSPWYQLPLKQQTLMALPIQRAGRVFRLQCLGLCNCSLAIFASVIYSLSQKEFIICVFRESGVQKKTGLIMIEFDCFVADNSIRWLLFCYDSEFLLNSSDHEENT